MPARLVDIAEIQPSDSLREENFEFLAGLTQEQLDAIDNMIGMPQVWLIAGKLTVSDGNQRTAARASHGQRKILVDYQGQAPEYMRDFEEIVLRNARALQEAGITNPYDLLKT